MNTLITSMLRLEKSKKYEINVYKYTVTIKVYNLMLEKYELI